MDAGLALERAGARVIHLEVGSRIFPGPPRNAVEGMRPQRSFSEDAPSTRTVGVSQNFGGDGEEHAERTGVEVFRAGARDQRTSHGRMQLVFPFWSNGR